MNILSLDASSQATGWATRVNEKLEYGVIKIPKSRPTKARIAGMVGEILNLIEKYHIDKIIVEEVRMDGLNTNTAKVLWWLQGYLVIEVYKKYPDIEIEFMPPTSWRSKIGIQKFATKREEQKKKDIQYVKDKYEVVVDDDTADAIGILDAYMIVDENTDSFFI